MVQRIQSIFLLLTCVATGLMFFMPAADIAVPGDHIYEFYTSKVLLSGPEKEFITWNWTSLILNAAICLLALATVFVHNRKGKSIKPGLKLQLRLCYANMVLQLGLVALMWMQIAMRSKEMGAEWTFGISFVFPVVGIILTWMAQKNIIKDIATIESLDRIR